MTRPILARQPRTKNGLPSKPRKDFPLTPHRCGQWCKKVRGKIYYFGAWDDPAAAERKWERDREALLDGRNPDEAHHGDSLGWLCNIFMDSKELQQERGELSKRAMNDYQKACERLISHFGKGRRLESLRSVDIERYRNSLPDTWGPTTTNNHLRLVRTLFRYANNIEATDRAIPYAIGLKAVPKATVRKHQASKPTKEFTAAEIWRLHDTAGLPMRAFILLGLNAAYGTMDIARLRVDQIDFKKRWLGEVRGKTGIARGCWLWPETVAALREAIDKKPWTGNDRLDELAFLTRNRRPWAVDGENIHPLAQAFGKLKTAAKVDKHGVGHYGLRHVFETVASNAGDQQAVDFVMGHHDQTMGGNYREGIDPKRVEAVCKYVRKWFLAGKPKPKRERKAKGGAK